MVAVQVGRAGVLAALPQVELVGVLAAIALSRHVVTSRLPFSVARSWLQLFFHNVGHGHAALCLGCAAKIFIFRTYTQLQ